MPRRRDRLLRVRGRRRALGPKEQPGAAADRGSIGLELARDVGGFEQLTECCHVVEVLLDIRDRALLTGSQGLGEAVSVAAGQSTHGLEVHADKSLGTRERRRLEATESPPRL